MLAGSVSEIPLQARIGIVGTSPVATLGLTTLLSAHPALTVTHATECVDDLLASTPRADVVVLDADSVPRASLDSESGRLRAFGAALVVLVRPRLMSAARADVEGIVCVSWSVSTIDLVSAVARAARCAGPRTAPQPTLTERERAVLIRYATGAKAVAVAHEVGLAVDSVNTYVQRIRRKYEQAGRPAASRIDLYHRAVEDGLIPARTTG